MKSLPLFAKAIAALCAPYVVAIVTWAVNHGLDVDVPSVGAVEALIVSAVSAVAVYVTRNGSADEA